MSLIGLLVFVLLFCLVIWAIRRLMAIFEVPAQIQGVVTVVIVVVFCLVLISQLPTLLGSIPGIRLK